MLGAMIDIKAVLSQKANQRYIKFLRDSYRKA